MTWCFTPSQPLRLYPGDDDGDAAADDDDDDNDYVDVEGDCHHAQTRSRQHDRKCRLKSSQYTLIIPHRVIQLPAISFWVPETRMRLPQVNK